MVDPPTGDGVPDGTDDPMAQREGHGLGGHPPKPAAGLAGINRDVSAHHSASSIPLGRVGTALHKGRESREKQGNGPLESTLESEPTGRSPLPVRSVHTVHTNPYPLPLLFLLLLSSFFSLSKR